jgi:hypothetical protein
MMHELLEGQYSAKRLALILRTKIDRGKRNPNSMRRHPRLSMIIGVEAMTDRIRDIALFHESRRRRLKDVEIVALVLMKSAPLYCNTRAEDSVVTHQWGLQGTRNP